MESSQSESTSIDGTSTTVSKRLVIVADNSLIVEAIRIGFSKSREFNLVGYADGRKTSVRTITGAQPDVVLIDDMDRDDRALELVRELNAEEARISTIVLSVQLDPDWLDQVFAAGAIGAISKAAHPLALATLVRETVNGHIFHRMSPSRRPIGQLPAGIATNGDLPLTGRELEILQLVASGSTNLDVARRLWVTEQTVKFHLRNIYRKLDVTNRTQASHFAHAHGLVDAQSEIAGSVS